MEKGRRLDRVRVHVDMDAFYAAVECRDDSRLRSIPMAVGSDAMLVLSESEYVFQFIFRALQIIWRASSAFVRLCRDLLPKNFVHNFSLSAETFPNITTNRQSSKEFFNVTIPKYQWVVWMRRIWISQSIYRRGISRVVFKNLFKTMNLFFWF